MPDAAVDGGRERSGARPPGRGNQPQPVLAGVGDLRARGRRPERARPRRLAPLAGLRHQPLHAARRRRQHALHDVRDAPDDGADPRPAADEPVRRGGDADVRRVPGDAGDDAVTRAAAARAARRAQAANAWGAGRRWR